MEEKMLTLRSSDNKEFKLKESVAMQSVTLKKIMEDGCTDTCIPLPRVTSHILAKIIEYCNKHAHSAGPGDAAGATTEDELTIFDAEYVKVEQDTLFDLILAANILDIKGLLDLTRQIVADMLKGEVHKETCKTSIKNCFTVPSKPASAAAVSSSEQKQMDDAFNAYWVDWEENAKERLAVFAEQGETARKHGYLPVQPPLEIFKYPELLERAWGWDMILPYSPVNSWSLYKIYLQEYYKHNAPAALTHQMDVNAASDPNFNRDDVNGLAALFDLCINKEGELVCLLNKHPSQELNVDEFSLNDKLTSYAHQITNAEFGGFPALSIALKCIMVEADLLCKLLVCETGITSNITICRGIRKCAFRFMTYKGHECLAAAATMMATTKEAKLMSESLRKKSKENSYGPLSRRFFIRNCTLGAMFRIFKEYSAVEESTRSCSEKGLVNKYNLVERDGIQQKTEICSKEELPKGYHLGERKEANHGKGEMNVTEEKN